MDKNLQNKELEDRIDSTLDLAENLQKQEIKPYFYTRLMSKIDEGKKDRVSEPAFFGFSKKLAMGIVGMLLVVNSLTVYFTLQGSSDTNSEESISRQENIEKVADEYFGGADYYNY